MIKLIAMLIMSLVFLAACNASAVEGYVIENENFDIAETSQFLPSDFASSYFERLQAMWDADDGEMWGLPMHLLL